MKFYAPENLDLNKLSAPLAHKVINFFVDKIKELKRIDDRGPGLKSEINLVEKKKATRTSKLSY